LIREDSGRAPARATAFLDSIADEELRVDVHVLCELLAGAELASHPALERQRIQRLSVGLHVVYPDERFPSVYAKLVAVQERARQRVPAMDLLIATAAIIDSAPLVTRDVHDFSRIPGLEIESY
jgi:tRNA(fMet)-specific endonuclease VapC